MGYPYNPTADFQYELTMSKHMLRPEGTFPAAGLGKRLAAMFYDSLLCIALLIVVTFLYKLAPWRSTTEKAVGRRRTGRRPASVFTAVSESVRLFR